MHARDFVWLPYIFTSTRKIMNSNIGVTIISRQALLDPRGEDEERPKKKFPSKRFRDITEIYHDENLVRLQQKIGNLYNMSNYTSKSKQF